MVDCHFLSKRNKKIMHLAHWAQYIWGNNVCKPQVFVVLKKDKLTVALRRINFIHLFTKSLLLTCSRKISAQVLFSYSSFL